MARQVCFPYTNLILFVSLSLTVACGQSTSTVKPQSESINCSNIVALAGNVNVNCSDLTPEQRKELAEIPAILNRILTKQLPVDQVMQKLDEIQRAMAAEMQGGVTTGPCSNVQIGGVGNNSQTKCGPVARRITDEQRDNIVAALKGRQVIVRFGALYNVADARQYAFEICEAFRAGGAVTNCGDIPLMVEAPGHPWTGVKIIYKGSSEGRDGQQIAVDDRTPPGIVIAALMSAGINQAVVHLEPSMSEGEVMVTVGQAPSSP